MTSVKREGDGATPLGTYPARRVYYRPDRLFRPGTALPVTAIRRSYGWCDDPDHSAYNRLVNLPFQASHEAMWRQDRLYDVVVELGYNDDPPHPGRGSAIFLHLARPDFGPTEGCIAVAPATMRVILRSLRSDSVVAIGRTASG